MDDFQPLDYIELAESMIDSVNRGRDMPISKSSPVLRTAISRLYYAAFLFAREVLKDRGVKIPQDTQVHRFVASKLGEKDKFLADQLIDLRKMRNRADYDLPPKYSVTAKDARRALTIARSIIDGIRNCCVG